MTGPFRGVPECMQAEQRMWQRMREEHVEKTVAEEFEPEIRQRWKWRLIEHLIDQCGGDDDGAARMDNASGMCPAGVSGEANGTDEKTEETEG